MPMKFSAVRGGKRIDMEFHDLGVIDGAAVSEWHCDDGQIFVHKTPLNPDASDFDVDRMRGDDDFMWGLGFRRWRDEFGVLWLPGDPFSPAVRAALGRVRDREGLRHG